MLRKLSVNSLRPGMYITNDVQEGLDHPLLYCAAGMLKRTEDVAAIHDAGYTEAFVDLARSDKKWRLVYGGSDEAVLSSVFTETPPKPAVLIPQVALQEELPQAKRLYAQAVQGAQRVMEGFRRSGQVDIDTGIYIVEDIAASVSRNANALPAVAKLSTKDDYTFAHCINVATTAVIFAKYLGYESSALHLLGLAGFFHDLGKMEIPVEILHSPNRLTPEAFAIMRGHPAAGYKHLKQIPDLPEAVALGALEHHERINGTGYPNGKKEDEISLTGKILAIVDVYDALSSRRVYKDPIVPHKALGFLYGMRDEDLVPELVGRFIQCIGVYPVGSPVRLNNNQLAVVSQVDPEEPLRPQVLPVRTVDGHNTPSRPLDLKLEPSLQITHCLDPHKLQLDTLAILARGAK